MSVSISTGNPFTGMLRLLIGGAMGVLLAACGGGEHIDDDLNAYVESVKARPAGKIEPLPNLEAFERFQYAAGNLGDPFKPSITGKGMSASGKKGAGGQPDMSRERGRLESFPLDSLRLVGSMMGPNGKFALIRTNQNEVFRVGVGEYLGQNYGKVLRIAEKKVELLELIPDGLGGWEEHPTTLEVNE